MPDTKRSTLLMRSRRYWQGIPFWAIVLITVLCGYLAFPQAQAMLHNGAWAMPREADLRKVEGDFLDRCCSTRNPYRVRTDGGAVVALACIPEAASAECLSQLGYGDAYLKGRRATIDYYRIRNDRYPGMENIIVTATIDGTIVIDRRAGLESLAKWRRLNPQLDRVPNIIFLLVSALVAFMLTTAWYAKLAGPEE